MRKRPFPTGKRLSHDTRKIFRVTELTWHELVPEMVRFPALEGVSEVLVPCLYYYGHYRAFSWL